MAEDVRGVQVEVDHAGSCVAETASSEVNVMNTGQIRHLGIWDGNFICHTYIRVTIQTGIY